MVRRGCGPDEGPLPARRERQEVTVSAPRIPWEQRGAATVEIVSFGYGHGEPPQAHVVIDVRHHFRDPHVDPALRNLTAEDAPVMAAVLGTPGTPALIRAAVDLAHAYWYAPRPSPLTIAVGCDIARPVITRPGT
jgi:RNase adaptor protein for sRNA GlmZ degradation